MKEGSGDFTSMKAVRTALAEAIRQEAGEEAVSFIGWADGLYAGYLDCILWEPEAVYAAAERFFRRNGFRQGYFHTFRRRIQTAYLLKDRPVMRAAPETARPVLTAEEIKKLESLTDDRSGYYGLMFQELQSYLVQGITEGGSLPPRPGLTGIRRSGMPMHATIWANMNGITGRRSGCPIPRQMPGAAGPGITAIPWRSCTAAGCGRRWLTRNGA